MARNSDYLQMAVDRIMILDMLARYSWEVDYGNPSCWRDLFTEDGIFEAPLAGLRVSGHEALEAFATDLRATLPNVHHVTSSFVIDLDGDRAKGKCELNEFVALTDGVYAAAQGRYEDVYVFSDGRWRIAHRRLYLSQPQALANGKVGQHYAEFFAASAKYKKP